MKGDYDKSSNFTLCVNERLDDLVRGGLRIIQSPESFCFSMDAVLLANFTSVKKGDRVVDLGTGTATWPPRLLDWKSRRRVWNGLNGQLRETVWKT